MPAPSIGIATVVKNEAPYLVEWLAHHRLQGIKQFFIADNESTDGTTELLAALQDAGLITFHHFPSTPGVKPHVPALEMLLERHHNGVVWLAIIDPMSLFGQQKAHPRSSHSSPTSRAIIHRQEPSR